MAEITRLRFATSAPVRALPRLAEVEDFLAVPWHDAAARTCAENTYRTWGMLAEVGVVGDAEGCIAEVWALHRADRLTGLRAWASAQGVPLEPLVVAEPTHTRPGVYHLAWRDQARGIRARLWGWLGMRRTKLEGGQFRRLPLGHPATAKLVMRLPVEVAHWAYLLGQRSEPEDVAIFEKVNDPDPILAVMVNDRWFMVCKWE